VSNPEQHCALWPVKVEVNGSSSLPQWFSAPARRHPGFTHEVAWDAEAGDTSLRHSKDVSFLRVDYSAGPIIVFGVRQAPQSRPLSAALVIDNDLMSGRRKSA
jgi:hypothetical protein